MLNIKLNEIDHTQDEQAKWLVEHINKYYPNTAFPPTLERIKTSKIVYLKAFINEDLIGITGIDQKTPALAETVKTIIFDRFRGMGYGKALSQAIEDECRNRGIKKVMTTIYSTNHKMISIKLKQGYTIEGFHPDHEAPGFDEYSLGKIL